ncbi:MAG: VWA domain-containing protein, partial [Chloroflexi bacterium]
MGHSVKLSVFTIMFRAVVLLGAGLLLMFGLAAGAVAQQEPLTVTLTNVESRDFPEISAWLTVSDAGGPVENLTVENFEIFEDDQPLAAGSVTVEPASMADLRLVFAIDTSTTDANLAEAKAAVVNMMSKLGPADKAALLSFGNKVNLEYNFTNNITALQAAVNRLSPRGEKTALHQATIDAAAMLGKLSAGRKAIIIVTNSVDNTAGPSPDEVFAQIQQSGAPLYIIGLGEKVQGPHPLKTQAALTGGQFFALKTTDSVQNVLLELEKSLRKGYRVSFHSSLKADNLSHALSINVSGAAGQGGTTGRFVATPGKIVVTPQGIA